MKLGSVSYIPPKGKLHSEAFFENVSRYPAKHPFYLFSDDERYRPSRLILPPDLMGGKRPPWIVNNIIFFTALALAAEVGLTYFLYVESDSRVGCEGWDAAVFDEFFKRYPDGYTCAGSPVCWDVSSGGREFAQRVIDMAWHYQQAGGIPSCFYGSKHPHDNSGACLYPNGSGAVFQTAALLKVFDGFQRDIAGYARKLTAWDMQLGKFLWNYHGPKAVDHVGFLTSSYSAYGNTVTTEVERLQMLREGRCSITHQVKSDAQP